jgi:hypothetical protein
VSEIAAGINGWEAAGLPVSTGDSHGDVQDVNSS